MRTRFGTILAASAVLPLLAVADDTPIAETSAAFTYAIDTHPSPRAVRTAAELDEVTGGTWKATRRAGEAVTLTSPSGATTTLVAADSSAPDAALPLDAGGVWTVANTAQGTATFTVRRSLDGTLGDGTAASPAKLVDGDELRDYGADENYTFTLDGADGLLARLVVPPGFRLEGAGEGVWRIVASADGSQYASAEGAGTYAIDTYPSPRAVRTAAELDEITGGTWKATRRAGEAVTLKSPSGATTTLAAADSSAPDAVLPLDAGGVWTVANTAQGTATFTVRRSLDGTLGDGTAASPAKLVDGDELRDYGANENYTFTLDGADGLLARLVVPPGFRLEGVGEGVWRIVASADGSQYACADIAYPADSVQKGPDRETGKRDALPVAYSGNGWAVVATGAALPAATITFMPPEGSGLEVTTWNRTGNGAEAFTFNANGDWTVTLAFADGTTKTATITIKTAGFILIVR